MRVYRALGDRKNAGVHDAAYRKHKDDETIRAIAGDFRMKNPYANRESLPIHVHAEAEPPPASRRTGSLPSARKATRPTTAISRANHPPCPANASSGRT